MRRKLLNLCLAALMSVVCTAAWAFSEVNGIYQIGSAEDYAAFVELVNGGERGANAILTADIDLGTTNNKIGKNNNGYLGTFDGAGHTITINFSTGTDGEGPALFHSIDQRAIIKRLKVQGTIHAQQYKHTAAIANYSSGVIRDCFVDVHVVADFADNADASIGGIVGQLNKVALVENCLSKIKITGTTTHRCGGLAAWIDAVRVNISNCLVINDPESDFNWTDGKSAGLVRYSDCPLEVLNLDKYNADSYHNRPTGASANNYVTNDWGKLGLATTLVSPDDVASGKVCYQLNSDQSQIRWVQNIGTDPYPVPAVFGTGRVYASAATNCQGVAEGELTFSNSGSDTAAKHTYDKYGVCTTCGQFNWNYFDFNDPEKYDISDKSFLISKGEDLFVAEGWNRFQNGCKFNLKLMNDVTCATDPGQLIFNSNDWIESSFHGQGHTMTIEMVDITEDYAAFFPKWYLATGEGAVFEDVIMHGTIGTSERNGGSICGRIYGSNHKVRNVFSDVTINTTHVGDCSHGGLMNCGGTNATFDNCIYAGDINGVDGSEAVAGLCGWANGTNYFNNCAFLGNLNNFSGDTQTISRNPGNTRCTNLYSLHNYRADGDVGLYTLYENAEGVANGELAFFLNGKQEGLERFYQKIGEDPMPMPIAKEGALVYTSAADYGCDGKPIGEVTYSNTYTAVVPNHQFEEGFCTICGQMDESYMTTVDGWYEIGTPAQLMWWANWAATHLDVSAKLTADIDMEAYCATYPDRTYPQIGNETTPFYGNFDGQYHTISNLNIYLPGCRGAGLISVMSSQPNNTLGGLSEAEARAEEGVFVKNVVLDKTCSIYGQGYTGVVGMAANWAGHITISGVLNLGDATVDGGTNGAGLFGCCMGSKSHMTISGCGFIGTIHVLNNTQTENGLFSGWLGQYAEVTNCFAMGTIDAYPDPSRSWARHPNYNTVVIKNCYGLEGSGVQETGYDNNPEDVTFIPAEEIASGALAWKANGEQFRSPEWYQTLGDDENPFPLPTHGTVIYGAGQYFSALTDADIEGIAPVIQSYEENLYDDVADETIATQAIIDAWREAIEALTDSTTIASFASAFDNLEAAKTAVNENAAVYQSYIDKCAEVLALLETDKTFEGSLRDALEYYLSEDITDEPDENNPLGTYGYIIENHLATAEEIEAEIARIDQWLQDAIAEDYKPGTDISKLIPNSDFAAKNTEHWTGAWSNAYGEVANSQIAGATVVGVEAWNRTGNMYQTVEGMKPGYYLVGVSGAFRPSNDRYSTNYAAGIYANGIFNYFPTVIEEYITAADTIDQVNCNLHGLGALDLPVYDDYLSTDEEEATSSGASLLGFAVHGPYGMAAAANAGRHQVYTIAYVGEDGNLTIGIKNPGTKYSNDWTGWGPIKVTYYGEEADDALDKVLENMSKRAQTIIDYVSDEDAVNDNGPNASPNFPAELRDSLQEVINAIDAAGTVEAKAALAERFSDLFQKVYDGKRAYVDLFNFANTVDYLESGNLPLVEKNQDNEWEETGEMVFSDDETEALYEATTAMLNAFRDGSFSTAEALDPASGLNNAQADALTNIMPKKDEAGYYLISNPKQFVAYRALVIGFDRSIKAKLVNDIDMAGIGMQPFGNTSSGTSDSGTIYTGTLDGQNHALENVYISFYGGRRCALFYELNGATVKNLKLTGEYHGDGQRMGGLTGWTSSATVENCEIAVALYNDIVGDATTGGISGVNNGTSTYNNCLVNCTFYGENANSFGGVCGWKDGTLYVKNTLIVSQYINTAAEPSSYPSDVVSRNGCNIDNVYYAERSFIEGAKVRGTEVTDAQLASGQVTFDLNDGDTSNPAWFQTLGTDETPRLFDGLVVYYRNGVYMNLMKGDVNVDTVVDIADAVSVLNAMAGQEVAGDADVNGDGVVDIADLVTVLNIMAGQ